MERRQVVMSSTYESMFRFVAGGDAVNGGAEVVNATAAGKLAGKGIQEFLSKSGQ